VPKLLPHSLPNSMGWSGTERGSPEIKIFSGRVEPRKRLAVVTLRDGLHRTL